MSSCLKNIYSFSFIASGRSIVSANKTTKQTTNSLDVLVRQNGELFINTVSEHSLNRVLELTNVEDGKLLRLRLVPGDLYRFISRDRINLGSGFNVATETTQTIYAGVTDDGQLTIVNKEMGEKQPFRRVSLNSSVMDGVYTNILKTLTADKHYVMGDSHTAFQIRDVTPWANAHLSNDMIFYVVDFTNDENGFKIVRASMISLPAAIEITKNGLRGDQFLIRQFYRKSNAVQIAFADKSEGASAKLFNDLVASLVSLNPDVSFKETRTGSVTVKYKVDGV